MLVSDLTGSGFSLAPAYPDESPSPSHAHSHACSGNIHSMLFCEVPAGTVLLLWWVLTYMVA